MKSTHLIYTAGAVLNGALSIFLFCTGSPAEAGVVLNTSLLCSILAEITKE